MRVASGQQVKEGNPQREDVRDDVWLSAVPQFGRHEIGRARGTRVQATIWGGTTRPWLIASGRWQASGNAEVAHSRSASCVDQDVLWLDVPMDDASFTMGKSKALSDVAQERRNPIRRHL